MNPRSGRTIPLYFKVSPEEKEIIDKKMELLGTHNQRAYLRKMAVDGYVVRVDMTDVKELAALLRTCSNNLNQIARRVNSTGNLYGEDIADLKTRYGELCLSKKCILAVFILSATINSTVDLTQYMITERTSYYGFYQYRKTASLGTQLH